MAKLDLGPGRRALDLAAGTGKLTRLLVPSGAELVAVEPVAAMRAELVARAPSVEALDGTAEALPLPDHSVDAAVAAQAFHWFDAPVALAELHRVLRTGGGLALVWNVRDESADWVRRFGELLVEAAAGDPASAEFQETGKPYEEGTDWAAVVATAGGFTPLQRRVVPWEQSVDADLLVRRAGSTSFVSALPDDARAAALDRIRDLAATHPDLAGRETFGFPHQTVVHWCRSTA